MCITVLLALLPSETPRLPLQMNTVVKLDYQMYQNKEKAAIIFNGLGDNFPYQVVKSMISIKCCSCCYLKLGCLTHAVRFKICRLLTKILNKGTFTSLTNT